VKTAGIERRQKNSGTARPCRDICGRVGCSCTLRLNEKKMTPLSASSLKVVPTLRNQKSVHRHAREPFAFAQRNARVFRKSQKFWVNIVEAAWCVLVGLRLGKINMCPDNQFFRDATFRQPVLQRTSGDTLWPPIGQQFGSFS